MLEGHAHSGQICHSLESDLHRASAAPIVSVPVKRTLVLMMFVASFFFCASLAAAQTFSVEGQQPETQKKQSGKAPKGKAAAAAPSSTSNGIGWGSSIEVGRMARAAEQALKKHDYAGANNFAQRAVNAAPQNGKLWFLLGYI